MADSSENESDEGCSQKPSKIIDKQERNTEKDLQTIFKKLRVDNNTRRFKTKFRFNSFKKRASYPTRTKTIAKKKILKDATFVYKSCSPKKESKLLLDSNALLDLDNASQQCQEHRIHFNDTKTRTLSQKYTNQNSKSPTDITKSCSGQFRKAQSSKLPCGDVNFDDTTPEELAAYFDQILHIPKPMSAMAEMMYT